MLFRSMFTLENNGTKIYNKQGLIMLPIKLNEHENVNNYASEIKKNN